MSSGTMTEVVALISGTAASRRAVLEWAARYVGCEGTVHVICDGAMLPALVSSVVLVDAEQIEYGDFAQAAEILAPQRCSWTWQYVLLGAYGHAMRQAARSGVIAVLPHRFSLIYPSRVRVVWPAAAGS